jgi:uncharacterized radical SAM superfamily Fe-S cluster-containing enzyme
VLEPSTALCPATLLRVPASVVREGDSIVLEKRCPEHGVERVLLADDAAYWLRARSMADRAKTSPPTVNTPVEYGCPYDCGTCADHEQHACLSLVEVCDACDLACPVCYAESGPHVERYRTLSEIERMLDRVVANEGEPDVVQLSGGEPTLHPELPAILAAMRARPIRHRMVNTNGVRLARDPELADLLAAQGPGFEVYLQLDSLDGGALRRLRGADLTQTRERALARLEERGVSTTLVVTVARGVNDGELGALVEYALSWSCVRGVTFQPVQHAGRCDGLDPARDRLTLTEVRRRLLDQSERFAPEDLVPVPCNPECIAMAYALRDGSGGAVPLTRYVDPEELLGALPDTIALERDPRLAALATELFSAKHSPESGAAAMGRLLCCLPDIETPAGVGYERVFRVILMQFLDAHSLEWRTVRRSCVHIAHPDGTRLIPFDTYNLLYRDEAQLAPLRAATTLG